MKICFVTHTVKKGDGQGRVNYEVITEAINQGHEIVILSTELTEELRNHSQITWRQINVRKIPTALLRYQLFAMLSAIWIWSNQKSIDLIVVNGFISYARSDINCIHFVHSAWVKSKYHPIREKVNVRSVYQYLYNWVNSFLERMALRNTREVIAVSEQVKKELIDHAKVNSNRISVITNGVDLAEFYPRSVSRSDFNLSDSNIYALFAGDLKSTRKNLGAVLKTIKAVENVHLLVLGSTKGSIYPQMAEDLGIKDRVHFLGFRTNIADVMSLADLFIYPSRYEACSLVLLEAMATGLPIITSSTCGGVELCSSETAMIIDDPDDVPSLINTLQELIKDRQKLQMMSFKARENAKVNSWENMSHKYLKKINYVSKSSLKG